MLRLLWDRGHFHRYQVTSHEPQAGLDWGMVGSLVYDGTIIDDLYRRNCEAILERFS
jgi:hypothetical protein